MKTVMRLLSRIARGSRRQRGQAIVEFALVAPMLMVLLIGSVDGGRALYAVVSVDNAAFHSAIWASNHLKQGTAGTPSCGSANAFCCPYADNTNAYSEGTIPTTIREIVLRDFLAGLTTTSSCPTNTSGIGSTCNPAVSCTTGSEGGYSYGGGTSYRYVDVTVTYRWNAVGPYGPIVGSLDIPRTTRIRKVP